MLSPDNIRYENGVRICEKIIPDNARAPKYVASWVPKGSPMKPGYAMSPIGITIHNTADLSNVEDDAEQYTRATWPNCNMGGVVVHYYVDDIGAWQNLKENESGWHASDDNGNGNLRTIAIECIMDGSGSPEDIKARDNAARLIASIMHRYNWSIINLYTHNHWMGLPDRIVAGAKKNCPIYLLPKYDEFKSLVVNYLNTLNKNSTTEDESSLHKITYSDISVGDILMFKGSKQYVSAGSNSKYSQATTSRVKVTIKSKISYAHPIHVRSVDNDGKFISGIYGWVDVDDLYREYKVPFTIRIKGTSLNYRKGPGVSYGIADTINDKKFYTIVEVKDGWGKLKSGAGWLNLSYTDIF